VIEEDDQDEMCLLDVESNGLVNNQMDHRSQFASRADSVLNFQHIQNTSERPSCIDNSDIQSDEHTV